jgi:hypothetical protein
VSGKGPVVISRSNGYRGATMVGPAPTGCRTRGPPRAPGEADDPGGPPGLDPEPPRSTDHGVTMPPSLDRWRSWSGSGRAGRGSRRPPKPRVAGEVGRGPPAAARACLWCWRWCW